MQEILFDSDGFRLRGVLHLPGNPHPPFVIGSHGLFSDGDSPKQVSLGEALSQIGIAFFRFDHRGCGKSKGDFKVVTSLDGRGRDILNAVKLLRDREALGPFAGLFGSSMGGAASLWAAARIPVPSVVTVAAPVRSREINGSGRIPEPDPLTVVLLKRKALEFDLADQLSRIRNMLIFHGEDDLTVPMSNAMEIFEKVKKPKRLIRFKGGDHRMSDPVHQAEFIREASRWFADTADTLSSTGRSRREQSGP